MSDSLRAYLELQKAHKTLHKLLKAMEQGATEEEINLLYQLTTQHINNYPRTQS
ncbi:MAG: hypothetical protein NW224_11975 [Leptolyngbyaceae cyanobacterium bins.302]|nr:hypothetical protein [Leptolyngbyaceae cyanobacterium bins.302]